MKFARLIICLLITVGLIYLLNNNWTIKNTPIPPLGKFLDPFHGFWQNIESRHHLPEQELEIPGLQAPVSVIYDSLLIPHIFAQNEDDLYLAQGYITATHRLWQMEFQIHAAAGRISEIIGEAALDYDRRQRRLGMVYGAEHAVETMMKDPQVSNAITQYTKGVNAYIDQVDDNDLPFEYKLLNYRPEPWTHLKMGLLLKNLSQTLNMSDNDFEMTNALQLFGKDGVDLLYHDSNKPTGDPIVYNPGGWKFPVLKLDTIPLAVPDGLVKVPPISEKQKGVGSNNWAVHGSKTASGAPLLANDPHLSLSFPSIWYVMHLNTPGLNVMGATLTGAPGVIIGFNDSIAWAVTNAQRDLVDWFKIEFQDKNRNAYLSDGEWKPVQKKIEKIRVRGGEVFYDTVIYTHHGPVVYDNSFHDESERNGYAFRWISHDGSAELKTLYKLNRSRNYDDYMAALDHWSGPAQNFAFASHEGDIAMRIQGKFPLRRQDEGKFVLDGTKTSTEWQAFIPSEQNVMIKNPLRGFVSSANQFPADSTYPYFIHGVNYETYRNRRINAVLSEKTGLTPEDMMKLQNDTYNLQAAESVPFMLSMLDKTSLQGKENQIVVALGNWDFYNTAESLPAAYYDEWWRILGAMLWDEMAVDSITLDRPTDYVAIRIMKSHPELPFYDVQSTPEKEDLVTVINQSFRESVKRIEKWESENGKPAKWGDYKNTTIQHLLRISPLSKSVSVGGGSSIVNAAGPRNGPSWRMVVSLEEAGPIAWGVYPGGQSGNPGSRHYDNLLPYWAAGKYYKLNFSGLAGTIGQKSIATTLLSPEK